MPKSTIRKMNIENRQRTKNPILLRKSFTNLTNDFIF